MKSNLNTIGIGGALLIIVGCFLPWVNVMGVSVSGIDGSDGWIFVVVGLLIAVFFYMNKRWSNITGIVLGLLSSGNAVRALGSAPDVGSVDIEFSIGIGVWLLLVGGILAIAGGAMALRATPGEPEPATAA